MPLTAPERGYPFVALAVLIVVIASPVVSLGGTRLAAARARARGADRLLPVARAAAAAARARRRRRCWSSRSLGALPLAAAADRGEPWFDYRSFAESLGPDDPVRFSWTQSYGPIDWPRDGNEVMRVVSGEPLYWKARNLDDFNGVAWQIARRQPATDAVSDEPFEADLPADWEDRPAWTETIEVSVRRDADRPT